MTTITVAQVHAIHRGGTKYWRAIYIDDLKMTVRNWGAIGNVGQHMATSGGFYDFEKLCATKERSGYPLRSHEIKKLKIAHTQLLAFLTARGWSTEAGVRVLGKLQRNQTGVAIKWSEEQTGIAGETLEEAGERAASIAESIATSRQSNYGSAWGAWS